MASPGRNPQRSLQSWRLLSEGFKLFATRLARNQQHMVWFGLLVTGWIVINLPLVCAQLPPRDGQGLSLEERRDFTESLGECIADMASPNSLEVFHQMTVSTGMSQRLAAAQERTQVLEERNRKLRDLVGISSAASGSNSNSTSRQWTNRTSSSRGASCCAPGSLTLVRS